MIDSHLVMNVLNLMAARDFKEHGRESPLLFALSDYLHVAFLHQEENTLLLVDELATLKARVSLVAEVQAGQIELIVHNGGQSHWRVKPGALSSVAAGLLGLARGHQSRVARLTMAMESTADALGRTRVTVEMVELNEGDIYDLNAASRRLAPALAAGVVASGARATVVASASASPESDLPRPSHRVTESSAPVPWTLNLARTIG